LYGDKNNITINIFVGPLTYKFTCNGRRCWR